MVLQPVLEGMLGLQCDALQNRLWLRPAFSPEWSFAEVRNIRVGAARIHFKMRRTGKRTVYTFRLAGAQPVDVTLQPASQNAVSPVRSFRLVKAAKIVL